MSAIKPAVTLAVCGHVDTGKSTLVGHLSDLLGVVPKEEMKKNETGSSAMGKASFKYAWSMDKGKDERERGITIECGSIDFNTTKYHYTVTDCPGHRDYFKHAIRGCANADVGLVITAASIGEFESSVSRGNIKAAEQPGLTREHAKMLNIIGVSQLIVGINKMDTTIPAWSQNRFNEIKTEMLKMLVQVGFPNEFVAKRVAFIPLCAFRGDNLVTKTASMPWYTGWSFNVSPTETRTGFTLLEALDKIVPPKRYPERPLLFAITKVYDSTSKLSINAGEGNVIVTGYVYQGKIQCNDIIGAICSGQRSGMVKQIENNKNAINMASAGDNVGLLLGGFAKDSIKHGDVIYKPAEGELKLVKSFTAQVFVYVFSGQRKAGYCPQMNCVTNKSPCKLTNINWKVTRGVKELNPVMFEQNEAAEVVFTPTNPIFLKPFTMDNDKASFSRILFMDGNLVMAGKVISVNMTTHTSVERGVLKQFIPQVLGSDTNNGIIVNSNSIKVKAAAAAAASDSGNLMSKQVIVADFGQPVSQLYPAVVDHHTRVGHLGGPVAKSKLWCLCCINRWWLSKSAVEGINDSPLLVTCAGWDNEEDGHSDCVKLLD